MLHKKHLLIILLLVSSATLIAGCTNTATTGDTVKANDTITVDYVGWLDNGTIFDTSDEATARQAGIYDANISYEPMSFVVGSGSVIEGFDKAVTGMKLNESKNITLTPAEAYGEYDPSLIQPISMDTLTQYNITPHVNDTLYYGNEPVRVDSIPNNTTVMIDFNHPMAGKTLHFKLTIRSIQAASPT